MLGSTGQIDYALDDFECHAKGGNFETTVRTNNLGDFSPPLPIALSGGQDGEEQKTWVYPTEKIDVFRFQTPYQVIDVSLDPDMVLLDVDRSNNDHHLNLDFDLCQFSINPGSDHKVMVLPYLWSESLDKFKPGVIFWRKNLIPWSYEWYLRAYYGSVTKAPGLIASVRKKLYPEMGHEIDLQGKIQHRWFYKSAEVATTFGSRSLAFPDDKHKLKVGLMAQNLSHIDFVNGSDTANYLDPQIWKIGSYLSLDVSLNKSSRRTLWSKEMGTLVSLGLQEAGKPFYKIQSYFKYRKRYSYKGSVRFSFFARAALGDLPSQERFYLSTSMDPDLDNKFILSRDASWYAPGHLGLYPDEYSIPGFLYDSDSGLTPSTLSQVGFKVRADIPKMEALKLLLGVGLIQEQNEDPMQLMGSISPVFQAGPLQLIYTPIRVEAGAFKTDWSRFQIALDFTTGGRIRLGI